MPSRTATTSLLQQYSAAAKSTSNLLKPAFMALHQKQLMSQQSYRRQIIMIFDLYLIVVKQIQGHCLGHALMIYL